jgi:hypothetical protein
MSGQIINKLRINTYGSVLALDKPGDIHDLDSLLPDNSVQKEKYNTIFAFVFTLDEFMKKLQMVIEKDMLDRGGNLFFIYPKKGNKRYKEYIGRDDFFERVDVDDDGYVKGSLLKFFKMLAFDDTFTLIGLKHEETRKGRANQLSQCVSDYIGRIPDLQKHFAEDKEILAFFYILTPGYQRGWARFVYNTRSEETVKKRLDEMAGIIRKGYKSIDLYRADKRK